ncbi:Baculoviral IAP repeat-containing protein 6 [Myotis davidii]|uniref:Baculoviral IAP repeat-containing protein 6 n=1 Tax=Myotis davidii TaxID=225400 RepID=L5LMT9_MYODS|nr:Baculoviral IAP repeat-containing protein 6 [Myotis davidii]
MQKLPPGCQCDPTALLSQKPDSLLVNVAEEVRKRKFIMIMIRAGCGEKRESAKPGGQVKCQYISAVDKVIFVDDYAVGCRKDLNGILLLDTALQTPVSKQDDVVQLELPVTEAQQLLSACLEKVDISSTEGYDMFITQLKDGLKNTSHETAANHKVAKWATVTFHLPHHVLKSIASAIVNELKKINQNVAALPVASSVMDRLSYLLPSARPELGVGPGRSVDRSLMYSEANRRETFTSWPHVGYRWAQPDPMAQAGFYHQPASSGDDRAMCFTCSVCLVCWEPTDEPWSEHERHSPNCPFVKGEHTQNVPLSVTLATSPAQFPCTDGTDRISCFGSGSCPHFLAAATKRGKICIWDVSKLMKVHLKFEINAYDPAIVQQLILSGEPSSTVESRRPTLAWLEDSSSCSDIPKLEGDSDDLLEDSDSEEHSRSDSVTGHISQKEAMEMSLDITALSILQQPEKLQWEIVANVLEDTVKDLEELGANSCLTNSKSEKTKEKHQEQHNIPFPCLLAGGLLTYKSPATSPTSSNSHRSLDGLSRTQGESISEQGSTDNESCTNSELNSPLVRRTLPILLLYSIKESDEKAGKIFSQMNSIMSKSLHDDGFTVPQIIEMELDSQEQMLLQDPPVTYIQQFADAAANLTSPDSEKWNSVFPKPGTLVQCLRLPKFAEEENLCIDSITPCADGIHLLVGLRTCPVESLSAINQVEALNNLNKLNSALCNRRKGELESNLAVVNGANISVIQHESPADVQTPLIIQPEQRNVSGGYLILYKMNYATRIVTLEEEPIKVQHIKDPQDAITSLILLPPDILDNREDDCEEPIEEMQLTSKNGIEREKKSDISTLGHLVITTQGGYVKILDLSNFEILAKVEPPKKEGTEEQDMFVSVIYCSGTDRLCACTKGGELHFLQIGGTCDDIDEADILVDGSLSKGIEPSSEGSKPLSNPSSPGISGVDLLVDQPFTLDILTSLVELTRFETLTPRFSATVPPCWVEVQQEQQQRRHPQHLHQQHHGDAAQHTRTWKLQTDSNSWDEHVFELVLPKACMVGHVDFKFVLNSNITNIPQIQVTLLKNKAPGLGKVNALNIEVEQNGKPSLVDLNEEMQHMDVEESQCLRLCPFLEDHKEDILCGPVWLASGLDLSGHAGMLTLTSPKLVKGMAGGKYRSFLIHVKAVNERGTDEICNGGMRPVVRLPSLKHQSNKGYSLASLLAKVAAVKEKSSNVKNENASGTRKAENLRGCDLLQEVSVTIRRFKKTSISKERVQRCAMLQFSEFHEKLLNTLCRKADDDGQITEHAQSLVLDTLCWLAGVHSNGPGSSKEGNESLLSKTRKCLSDIVRVCFFEAGRSIAHKCARFLALCIRYGLYSSPFDPVLFDLEMSGSTCKNVYNSSIGVQSDEIDLSDVLSGRVLDIPMISWVVMLVSRLLDYVATVEDEAAAAKKPLNGNQWSFINNNLHTQNIHRSSKGSSSLDRLYSRKIRKQLVHHKQQLNLLKAKQKALVEQMEKEKIQSNKGSSYKLLVEQAKLKQATSKVLARIANATRPTIHLCEIVNEPQLERLLLLLVGTDFNRGDISWGGAWAQYSLTCMLQDILAGELLAPVAAEAMEEGTVSDDVGATAAESDDCLQQSSVQLLETIDEPLTHDITGAPPLSSLEKDKEIDLELLQDLMEVDIDPLDIDLEKDPLAAKVFKLESLLQLWLTLSLNSSSSGNKENGAEIFLYNANRIPVISLNQASITSFLTVLAWYPNTLLRTWCLVLHSLTIMTNMQLNSGSSSAIGTQDSTAHLLVSDPNLIHVLVKFLSGTSPHGTNQHSPQVGPTATQAMQEFLTRLQVHLSSTCPQIFSEFLLKLIHILSTERGAFQTGQGPLDAQVKLLEFTLEQNFEVVSVSTISAVIESVTFLVHHYITCSDKVMSRSGSDSSVGARACFGGLFANLIRPGDAKAVCGEMTRDQLMFDMLKLVNILVQLPLSGNREYSARVSVTTNTTDSVSDEEKVSGGKDGNGSNSSIQGSPAYVADLVLANQQIMSQILSALGLCNSSAMAMIIGASGLHLTKHENFHGGLDAISVGDGLFTILTTLSKKASTVHMMLQPILTYMACGYMGRQGSLATCQLSEPLLWFILRVLDTSDALKAFHDMGGVQLICNNMVTSTRAIVNTARSMVSTIMKFLDSGPNKAVDSSLKTRILASEPDNAEGIHNFAPLGTITSSSPTAQPAEVLLQATPPHRRARSAAWSYIFLPEEAWCDLTIHLPAAVLLKEIHIQPHLASLATCPSSVSVEVSADGINMLPLSTPVVTSGLTYIKIQLVKAEVASAVCLRLHRPRDASTLGLSQIKLLGLTAFGTTSSATVNNPFLPSEDQVSKTSIGWLRLLHHCLTHISDLEGMMASAAAPTANLLQTCAALLMSPYCGMHSPNIEVVLVKIGLQSTRIGLKLIDILLRNCAASGSDPTDLNSPLLFGRLNGLSSDSTIDILYQLGTTQDTGTKDRIQALLKWVSDSARVAAMKRSGRMSYMCPTSSAIEYGLLMPSPSHLHCVAAILWHSYELLVEYDLPALLDRDLFELLFNWSMSLPCNMVLKKAVDSLLCSMCHVHPSYFSLLMGWMGITPPPMQCHHRLSMTDDSKKQDLSSSLTDDSKNAQAPLALTESHLATLASSSQSPEAIKQLLDSGLPSLLVRSLASFCFSHISYSESVAQSIDAFQDKLRRHHVPQQCNKMPITADLVAPILRFLTEVGSSHVMKDWLGGSEVNPLWTALLFLLCHSGSTSGGHNLGAQQTSARSASLSSATTAGLTAQQRTAIENATVAFFLQCISCHPNNQKLMAQLYKGRINATSHVIQHPMYGAGHKFRTLHLPVSTTLSEVLDRVSDTPSITAKLINEQKDDKEKKNHEEKEKVKAENGFQDNYSVVVASGLKSQSKRAVSATPPRPPSRRGRAMPDKIGSASSAADNANKIITVPVFHLYHKLLAGQPLPAEMTLAQLLTLLYDRKLPQGYRSIDLTVKLGSRVITDPSLSKTDSFKRLHPEKDHGDLLGSCPEDEALTPSDECMDGILDESLLETCPIQSPLQVFAGMGGLALIAERLPMLYPEVIQQVSTPVITSTTQEKPKDSDQFEWVTIEQSGELVYEAPETIAAEPPPIKSAVQTMSPIPAHSLAAFGLFLRLPGYAEVLLKERKHAQCLLRLVLGVTDDGEGSHILQSPSANVLPTLPFHVLRSLFSTTPLTTDDGVLLRRMALEIGALHLILVCLSALSHHAPRVPNSSLNQAEPQVSSSHNPTSTEEQQLYWAKGTGFGTGSTASGWDVEQALTKQRLEEEHVTCLLQVLASYINPMCGAINGEAQSSHESRGQNSNALPSVLLELLSQSCLIPAMSSYLRNDSVLDMARHVPLYRALLELLRAIASCTSMVPLLLPLSTENGEEEEEQSECQTSVGTLLAKMKTCVDTYTNRLRSKRENAKTGVKPDASDQEPEGLTLLVPDIQRTAEIVYAATTSLRQANQDTFEMVSEDEDGKLGFKVNYHYMSQVKNANDANSAARARRLAQEAVTLSTSLPLSSSSSVFVRCDEERLDIMKVLITGPADTPYANGCFEFDVYFPQDYPSSPPLVNLETTGGHSVRFNPNLYNDGKVLVSVQSLILVAEPYFNEPGYERSRGTPSGTQSSREYDGNIRQATVKWAMLEQIRNPSPCFKEVIHKHFYLKRVEIMAQCEEWIADIQQYSSDKRVGRTMSHHAAALKRHTAQLREELLKLPCPDGLDPDVEDASEMCSATAGAEGTLMHDQVKPCSSKELPSDFKL